MTKEESKIAILAEWERWQDDPSSGTCNDMQMFFLWLEKNRPDLLRWRIRPGMDRWQDVRGWLNVRTGYGRHRD